MKTCREISVDSKIGDKVFRNQRNINSGDFATN